MFFSQVESNQVPFRILTSLYTSITCCAIFSQSKADKLYVRFWGALIFVASGKPNHAHHLV